VHTRVGYAHQTAVKAGLTGNRFAKSPHEFGTESAALNGT